MNTLATAIMNETTITTTENGAVTYETSLNSLVDMFFLIGAKRGADYNQIVNIIAPAFKEDPELATRIALWARDIRGGAGERQTFRHILNYMINNGYEQYVFSITALILEVGRTDDLFEILKYKGHGELYFGTLDFLASELDRRNGLVAKWIPRKGPVFNALMKYMERSPKEMRRILVDTTKVVETQMCAKKWDEINYSHVPSKAMTIYNKAFTKHDGTRFNDYKDAVKNKTAKINTSAVYPYEIIKVTDSTLADNMWKNLPDFVPSGISFLPVIDTSSSMIGPVGNTKTTCMDVAVSLGIYLAERNKSAFKDMWLNFSTNPVFRQLKGEDIHSKVRNLNYSDWGGSTNLGAAMRLIVDTAVNNEVAASDMPDYLIVLSDMEFNQWGNKAPGINTKNLFEAAGYKMPNIIWWNIQSRNDIVPVRFNEKGMGLVSGFSPAIMKGILGGNITPVSIMMDTIMNERYNFQLI